MMNAFKKQQESEKGVKNLSLNIPVDTEEVKEPQPQILSPSSAKPLTMS